MGTVVCERETMSVSLLSSVCVYCIGWTAGLANCGSGHLREWASFEHRFVTETGSFVNRLVLTIYQVHEINKLSQTPCRETPRCVEASNLGLKSTGKDCNLRLSTIHATPRFAMRADTPHPDTLSDSLDHIHNNRSCEPFSESLSALRSV
jgi:hypothetical protein